MGVTLPSWLVQALFQTQCCLFLAWKRAVLRCFLRRWPFPILLIETSPKPQQLIVFQVLLTQEKVLTKDRGLGGPRSGGCFVLLRCVETEKSVQLGLIPHPALNAPHPPPPTVGSDAPTMAAASGFQYKKKAFPPSRRCLGSGGVQMGPATI